MQVCGEHKESGILRSGFFSSPFSPEGLVRTDLEVVERCKGDYLLLLLFMLSFIGVGMIVLLGNPELFSLCSNTSLLMLII